MIPNAILKPGIKKYVWDEMRMTLKQGSKNVDAYCISLNTVSLWQVANAALRIHMDVIAHDGNELGCSAELNRRKCTHFLQQLVCPFDQDYQDLNVLLWTS